MATIKQIAQLAGVAVSTVSRVLNHDPSLKVSREKRAKIEQIATELDYQSPSQRKRRRQKQANLVGRSHFLQATSTELQLQVVHFLTPTEELSDPYFTAIRIGIENRCHQFNISFRSCFTNNLPYHLGLVHQAQGVICVGHFSPGDIELIQEANPNLIFIDSNPAPKRADAVTFDRQGAAREIVQSVIASGARHPAFIGNREDRLFVFQQLTQNAAIYDEALCKISSNFRIDEGYQAMAEILDAGAQPDVVFAATDIIAIGVYRAIQERGIEIPAQIQVVGMNDIPTAQHLSPSLSTMRLYPTQMGEAAVDLFLELVEGRHYHKNVQIGYEMIWRESFQPPVVVTSQSI